MNNVNKMKKLVEVLNEHRDAYYNKQSPTISDYEYDNLFDELKQLEEETGVVLSNSPTVTVGYEVKSGLKKVKHSHPMLSLDKTKSIDELAKFLGDKIGILMLKLDGLTVSLRYMNGQLVSAETRGNGEIGEDILHNAKVFSNIPLQIDYKGEFIVDGEAIITYDTFEHINSNFPEGEKYKNPRNLVSGSVRQLDNKIAAERNIKFIAWKMISDFNDNSFSNRLITLSDLGFETTPFYCVSNCLENTKATLLGLIDKLKRVAEENRYPIDGMVLGFDDVKYGESLGMTGHHLRSQMAFKFYDEEVETTLKNVEFTMGKTGILTPTAIFQPVEIDGTTVERASVHNISILEELELMAGDIITVYKSNQIIPQISENLSAKSRHNQVGIGQMDGFVYIPTKCPICGGKTEIKQENSSKVLICTNSNCNGKLLGKLTHFVSKNAMNIDGLSEATLEKFIELGWVNSFEDIYNLNKYYTDMIELDGFGEKSVNKLLDAITLSDHTTLDRFIYALCIPLIGRAASKTISKHFDGSFDKFYNECCLNNFAFESLDDFGASMSDSMRKYLDDNSEMINELAGYLTFKTVQKANTTTANITGKTFVITGSLNTFENRDAAKEKIEALGGKVSGSVSAKTSYLVNNDINSTSGKNKKAKELGVPIITEDELLSMMK